MHSEETKQKISKANKEAYKSEELRERMRDINLGKKYSAETRKKISIGHKGIKKGPRSEETKKKISESNKGKKMSIEARQKMSNAKNGYIPWNKGKRLPHLSGINSPKWKGGKKDIQEAIRVCAEYSDWRLEVYKRDGFMCQFCHTKGVKLNAHHLKFLKEIIEENKIKTLSDALLCKEVWFISNGITLCKSCHTSLHNQEKKELRTL